jgi:hypothetical protein
MFCTVEQTKSEQTTKIDHAISIPPTPAKTLVRRGLETMKSFVGKYENLGISVELQIAREPRTKENG